MYNDAFTQALIEDWDDYRTFGFAFSVQEDFSSLSLDYMETTYRGDTPTGSGSSRSTHVRLLYQGHFSEWKDYGSYLFSPAAGVDIEGDLGGSFIQHMFHDMSDFPRDLPSEEETQNLIFEPLLGASIGFKPKAPLLPALRVSSLMRVQDGWSADAGLLQMFYGQKKHIKLEAFYTVSDPSQRSQTMALVQEREKGLGVKLGVSFGLLYYDMYRSFDGKVGHASVGIGLSRNPKTGDFPSSLDNWYGMAIGKESTGTSSMPTGDQNFSLQGIWGTSLENLYFVTEAKSGGLYETENYEYALRNQMASIAVEAAHGYLLGKLLLFQPYGRLGFNYEKADLKPFITEHTYTVASIQQLLTEAEVGVRLFPFPDAGEEVMYGLGIGVQGMLPVYEIGVKHEREALDPARSPRLNLQFSLIAYRN